jgi:hypothetical protein
MRIGEFIRTYPDEIEPAWEAFAKSISSFAPELSVWSLRDHLPEILTAMADDMESLQSLEEQAEKSEGKGSRSGALDRISALHARLRLNSGFNLEQPNTGLSVRVSCSCGYEADRATRTWFFLK